MKKNQWFLFCFPVLLFGLSGCVSPQIDSSGTDLIQATPLSAAELGEGFQAQYLPDASNIHQFSGTIDVALDFEGTQVGWKKVASEYERLQSNKVKVNINDNLSGSTYSSKLNEELLNPNTDWDICEGNLGYTNIRGSTINMYSAFQAPNAYCGKDTKWANVLSQTAYRQSASDTSAVAQIVNSEIMQSCWFVNTVAMTAAGEKGYKNSEGEVAYPKTWDDLISLCSYMEDAGYTNPLGISLASSSVESLQFTWLLRIYGDYYYRQFYKYSMASDVWTSYSGTREDVETFAGFGFRFPKVMHLLFDEEDNQLPCGYVGFHSDVYKDFVSQLAKMKGHLMENVDSTEFSALRDLFRTQSRGKSSPQIILDYQGFGLNYLGATSSSFSVGYFDYPTMVSGKFSSGDREGESIVPENTITRDIGGNGGFLSIINHLGNKAQNDLNQDFLKFFLSPYGQTIYYQGLAENGVVPKGLSTVKNELIVIPQAWKDYFANSGKTITFSGNVDQNVFLSYGVRYVVGYKNTQAIITENWRKLLMSNVGSVFSVTAFCNQWADACFKDMKLMCADNNWPTDAYLNPNLNL